MARVKRKQVELPTISVGGTTITEVDSSKIKEDLKEKVEKYRLENPEKPKTNIKPVNAPLDMKYDISAIDKEFIAAAKKCLGIPEEKNLTIVDFAKHVIKLFNDNISLIKELNTLKLKLKNGNSRMFFSSESNGSWN